MSVQALNTALKQHLHGESNGSHGSTRDAGVGEGLAILPTNDGRHSVEGAVLSRLVEHLSITEEPEQEVSDFQVFVQGRRMLFQQLATDKPILGGFSVSMPRKDRRKHEKNQTVEVVGNLFRRRTVRLEGLTGPGNERLIFADFDLLPEGYPSFEMLEHLLSGAFHERACVIPSSGGHLKVMFRTTGKNWNKEEVRQFLAWQFGGPNGFWTRKGERLNKRRECVSAYCIDRQGTDHTFINMDMLELMQKSYSKLPLFTSFRPEGQVSISSNKVSSSTTYSIGVAATSSEPFSWKLYAEPLPAEFSAIKHNGLLEKVVRMMAGSFYLSTKCGIALPQVRMGSMFGVSQPQISNAIRRLVEAGVIRLNISACHLQRRAAKYQFVGSYMEWAKKQYEGIKAQMARNNSPETQKSYRASVEARFQPGEMNLALFEYTRFFDSFKAYLSACEEHSYFGQKPEHIHQAKYAWKCREKERRDEAEKLTPYLKEA